MVKFGIVGQAPDIDAQSGPLERVEPASNSAKSWYRVSQGPEPPHFCQFRPQHFFKGVLVTNATFHFDLQHDYFVPYSFKPSIHPRQTFNANQRP
jgi:hypothetical protein